MSNIEFISYDGEYPNLCRGELKVRIDGEIHSFHYGYCNEDDFKHNCFPSFWTSGGSVRFTDDYSDYEIKKSRWVKGYVGSLPERLRNLLPELLKVFNENVRNGCCGGCV